MKTPWFGDKFHNALRERSKEVVRIILAWPVVACYSLAILPVRIFGRTPTALVLLLVPFMSVMMDSDNKASAKKPAPLATKKVDPPAPPPPSPGVENPLAIIETAGQDILRLKEALRSNKSRPEIEALAKKVIVSSQKVQLLGLENGDKELAHSALVSIFIAQACYIEWLNPPGVCTWAEKETSSLPLKQNGPPKMPNQHPPHPIAPRNFPRGSI